MNARDIIEVEVPEDPSQAKPANARIAIEGESPKSFMRRVLPTKIIWNSRDYYLNVIKPGENWFGGEFCPVLVVDNKFQQMDGMYDLCNAVTDAVGYRGAENDPNEEAYSKGVDEYIGQMWDSVRSGVTKGLVNGVAGPRQWRLVYWPNHGRTGQPVEVEPGKQYGEVMPRDD